MADNKMYRFEIEDPETGIHMLMTGDKPFTELMQKIMDENPGISSWEAHHRASQMRIAEAEKQKEEEN